MVGHSITWHTEADEANQDNADYKIRVRAHDGTEFGAWVESGVAFTVNNNNAPSISVNTPSGPQTGNVNITYDLADGNNDPCTIEIEYQGGSVTFRA